MKQMPVAVRACLAAITLVLAAYALQLVAPILPAGVSEPFERFASNIIFIAAAALCGWRAVAIRAERVTWTLFAVGLLAWGLGDLYYTLALWDLEEVPVPSLADAGYLALYPLFYAGLVLLVRARVVTTNRTLWVDAVIGSLAVAALAATLLFDAIVTSTSGSPATVVTNLAYPIADLLVVALAAGVLAMRGWKLNSAWGCIAGGLAVFAVVDALYLYETAVGRYTPGGLLDAGWSLAALMLACAAWQPAEEVRAAPPERLRTIVLPMTLALACLAMLSYDHFERLNVLAVSLATATLLALLMRLGLTFADNVRMLAASRDEARTDALTGLGNRRALMDDLERALLPPARGMVLALYDLDGFKLYNDSFGHAAGDALLARLGHRLQASVAGRGRAYRMGGDEFCIICDVAGDDVRTLVSEGAFALTEQGDGFSVGCSFGSILLPHEADAPQSALNIVDARMYAEKHGGRASAGSQSRDVLRQALCERDADLAQHITSVAELAEGVARRLGLEPAQVEEVRIAAELHDVGKVAIPDAILEKPTALDDAEWAFMRRHTVIGERIVSAAPALAGVAKIVRSSHERIDGGGYPDGLSGNEIPLGARIIFVCDAYHAMTSARPYAKAVTTEAAVAELRRCAGTQFDVLVVDMLCALLEADAAPPVAARATVAARG